MKAIATWKKRAIIAALPALMFSTGAFATTAGKNGPVGESASEPSCDKTNYLGAFLEAQGSGTNFFPPIHDYVGWASKPGQNFNFALVDYAGVADKSLNKFNTKVRGFVRKCPLANGQTRVYVNLFTKNALGFAQSIADIKKSGFEGAPTIFGVKASDLAKIPPTADIANAALGEVLLSTSFVIAGPDFPDLVDVLVANPKNYAPVTVSFTSWSEGSKACPGATAGTLFVSQVAASNPGGSLKFTEEEVIVNCAAPSAP
jgi:hypothetical protein